jgi:hypothetical protein
MREQLKPPRSKYQKKSARIAIRSRHHAIFDVAMGTDTESKAPAAPPYISFKTLTNLLDRLQTTRLPPRIDRSYLDGMSGGYQSQVIAALRWLDLIGPKGEVEATLVSLATTPEQRQEIIGDLLRTHYPTVLALSDANSTQGQLEEEFRSFGVSGSTLRRAIAFFLHAARYAEIPVSPHFKIPPVPPSSGRTAKRKFKFAEKGDAKDPDTPPAPKSEPPSDLRTRYIEIRSDPRAVGAAGGLDHRDRGSVAT